MRMLSRIIFVAMLAMAVIIIPLGAATIIMAIELGLFFEALSGMLMHRYPFQRRKAKICSLNDFSKT